MPVKVEFDFEDHVPTRSVTGRVCAATTLAPTRSADPIEGSMIAEALWRGPGEGSGGMVVRSRMPLADSSLRF